MTKFYRTYLLPFCAALRLMFLQFRVMPLVALLATPLVLFLTVLMLTCGTLPVRAQYWHVGINQGVAVPFTGIADNSPQFNWMPSFTVHYFPKNNNLVFGGSISMQYFAGTTGARLGEHYELLSFPISMSLFYMLLPEPPFRPYYGVELGATWFRYRFFERQRLLGNTDNIGLLATPNLGAKIELFEGLDLDLNVRYQLLFHERVEWGSAGKSLSGYTMLGVSVGLNYQMFRGY